MNIASQDALDRTEAALAALRSNELRAEPIVGKFDLAHLQAIHRHLFKDIYAWAGDIRSVDITKGSTRFASHEQIVSYAPQITRKLAQEQFLKGLTPSIFSARAGHYLGELNVLHPFREGNGRSIREFIGQLARGAGYDIDWRAIERDEMTQAAIEAYHGDSSRMARLIQSNLQDPERAYVLDLVAATYGHDVQLVRAEAGHTYAGAVLGLTERYVVQAATEHVKEIVLHNRRALSGLAGVAPGSVVDIRYPHGAVGIVDMHSGDSAPSHDTQRDMARDHRRDLDR
ncbi:Fic/DOC family protein [Bordetella genomosp. 8]|uniref:Fic/DOC family protein n=1 Tax=Bordetella genomosp. 8 TaxID=1416806 RepID=UPI0018DFFC28|nr:Fic family protein [Bordetella genomosp. 8]